jgi:lipoyl(octanoyl) transferase
MDWYYLNTGFNTGKFNMDLDEQLAHNFNGIPILRVYGWKPFCISLGYNQNIEDINMLECEKENIDIVRRPTGGRAILHSEELTYSVIMDSDGKGVHEIYKDISIALQRGLVELGAEVEFAKSQPDFQTLYKDKSSIPCFTSSARYEIEYKGKKLVGSAQRRFDNIVLQHGSILIGDFHKQLPRFLSAGLNPKIKEKIESEINLKTVTLNEILNRNLLFEDAASSIRKGFELEYKINFQEVKIGELCQ